MKIRTKLTIKNICVTATVLLVIFGIISFVSEYTRSKAFFHDLKGEALTKANLFFQKKVDAETMQSIYLNNKQFINEVEVAVYTTDFEMLYHDAVQNDIIKEDRQMIDRILNDKEIEFYVDKYQGIGLIYEYDGNKYVVTAAAYDGYGYDNLRSLQNTLIVLFFVGLGLLFFAGYFLAKASLRPIREIVRETEKITSSNMDNRLEVKNANDELGELCKTFNDLLTRLEVSFNAQKQFVGNISHELRTPLAALSAEIDLALQKERTVEQYRSALQNSLGDARRMTRLIDGLLNLAKADYQKAGIKMEEIRLDELLLDVRQTIIKAHPEYRVELFFDIENDDDSDNMITVYANTYLLSIAFSNLIENNCKYSSDHCSCVQISYWESMAIVRFSDYGTGMTDSEKQRIFDLFYRGSQENNVEGHGIGMTLAQKIINLHEGTLIVHTQEGEGTTFVVEIKHI